ncbi:MAG: hypothetical protein ACI3ZY_13470 [Parabacteroides sp.]
METTNFQNAFNEDTVSLESLKSMKAPFEEVAQYIQLLDRSLYRLFDIGIQPFELIDLLDAHAERLGVDLGALYDQLPKRYQEMLGTRALEQTYRMELIELRNGCMQRYPDLSFSPHEWHGLIKRHPDWVDRVPHDICQMEAFYYPLNDLKPAFGALRSRIPDSFYDRSQFQTEAIVSGLVSVVELGDRLLPENAPYVSVAQYSSLTDVQRSSPTFKVLAYGAVLYDTRNVLKVPTAYLSDVMIRHTACADFGLLSQLPYDRVQACPMTDELLCMAVWDQVKDVADIERLKREIPSCYQRPAVLKQLAHIAKMYGVELSSVAQKAERNRGRSR